MENMKWIDLSKQEPPYPSRYGDHYLATVINNQVVAVKYVLVTVRNKQILRWEWNNVICPWTIIAYMPFPKSYQGGV